MKTNQISMFDEFITDEDIDNIIDSEDGYYLTQESIGVDPQFLFKVFDKEGKLINKWQSNEDCFEMDKSRYDKSKSKIIFKSIINQNMKSKNKQSSKHRSNSYSNYDRYGRFGGYQYGYDDESDDDIADLWTNIDRISSNRTSRYPTYKYSEPHYNNGYIDKLNNSDTLVIHKTDPTTTMLRQIYEGKGWDVLNDSYVDPEEIKQLIQSHDRIVMLGHGSSYGLMGGNIGPEQAQYLKNKKLFVIWCNADQYFKRHNIGQGWVITKNVPSEVGEAAAIGCKVSAEWMLKNITYWSKCMADVVELAFENPQLAVEKARYNYQKSKSDATTDDELRVIDYNTDAIQVQR